MNQKKPAFNVLPNINIKIEPPNISGIRDDPSELDLWIKFFEGGPDTIFSMNDVNNCVAEEIKKLPPGTKITPALSEMLFRRVFTKLKNRSLTVIDDALKSP